MEQTRTILIVEDDLPTRELLVEVLGEEGYCVRAVSTVADARAVLAQGQIDLLLCEDWLPSMPGLALAHEIRQSGIATSVVVLTTDAEHLASFSCSDVACCLGKPFDLDILLDCVTTTIRRSPK